MRAAGDGIAAAIGHEEKQNCKCCAGKDREMRWDEHGGYVWCGLRALCIRLSRCLHLDGAHGYMSLGGARTAGAAGKIRGKVCGVCRVSVV